jgi:hypothetical protein
MGERSAARRARDNKPAPATGVLVHLCRTHRGIPVSIRLIGPGLITAGPDPQEAQHLDKPNTHGIPGTAPGDYPPSRSYLFSSLRAAATASAITEIPSISGSGVMISGGLTFTVPPPGPRGA